MGVGYAEGPNLSLLECHGLEDLVSLLVCPCTYKSPIQKCPGLKRYTGVQVEIPMDRHSQVGKVFAASEESAG